MPQQNSSTSSFKNFAKAFIPSIVLLGSICYAFQVSFEKLIIQKTPSCGANKIHRIISITDAEEIPMFGSSRMLEGLVPVILGKHYYNYGISAVRSDVVWFFLKEELLKAKSGPLIINLDLNGIVHGTGEISNYLFDIDNINVRELVKNSDQVYYHIPGLKYYGQYESYLVKYFTNHTPSSKYSNKGSEIQLAVHDGNFADEVSHREKTPTQFKLDPLLTQQFLTLLASHPKRMIVIVIAPYHKSFFKSFQNESGSRTFLDQLQKFKNVRILDFSKTKFPDSLFLNTLHLNYRGAVKYSTTVRDTLAKILKTPPSI